MKRLLPTIGGFACGVLLATAIAVSAQIKGASTAAKAPLWKIATVDTRDIDQAIPEDNRIMDAGQYMEQRQRKVRIELTKRTQAVLDAGYEPYAANSYSSSSGWVQRTYFFRKRVR